MDLAKSCRSTLALCWIEHAVGVYLVVKLREGGGAGSLGAGYRVLAGPTGQSGVLGSAGSFGFGRGHPDPLGG